MRVQVRRVLCTVLAVCLLGFILPASADGTDIKALQERLISLGYEIGTADGIVGKKTSAAIMLALSLPACLCAAETAFPPSTWQNRSG